MARKQQSWDFEHLHPDAKLSSFPDKEKASNVGEFTHSGSLGAGSEDAGVGLFPKTPPTVSVPGALGRAAGARCWNDKAN